MSSVMKFTQNHVNIKNKEPLMNHGGILILSVVIIIIASVLRLSTGQPELIFRLSDASFGCLGQMDKPYVACWA